MRTIDVALGERTYPVHVGRGLLDDPNLWQSARRGGHVLLVSNEVVAPWYLDRVRAVLGDVTQASLVLADGEVHKTLASAERIFDALATLGATRDACVVALGGGVIGDVAGFAAACWMRGIDLVQVPTTLLAMVDSAVGGKTAVNVAAGKNLVGAFHQPRAVIADTGTLATLPTREFRSGFAEVLKYGAIGDLDFFAWLEAHADALLAHDEDTLEHAIAASCARKAALVAGDEREAGVRALLNFGHTFAHAIEVEAGYGVLLHGEAVAIGMVLAARLSSRLGLAPQEDTERLVALLDRFGLPTRLPGFPDPDALLAHMRLDKKHLASHSRLILWRGIGRAEIFAGVPEDAIRGVLT
jgi:3-dehydroquinate synthase